MSELRPSQWKQPPRPRPQPPQAAVNPYELDDAPAPPPAPKAPALNRRHMVGEEEEKASAESAAKAAGPPAQPIHPKLVDPAEMARKREDARKRAAEELGIEMEKARQRKRIVLAGILVLCLIGYVVVQVMW